MVAFVHSGLTAFTGLKRAILHPGESLFVNGGSGNVGSAVIQLARKKEVRISRTIPLSEAANAHRMMEDGTHLDGKIVLTV